VIDAGNINEIIYSRSPLLHYPKDYSFSFKFTLSVIFLNPHRHTIRMTAEEFKSRLLPVKNKLFRLALNLLMNRQEAEDAVQEVYLKMWNMRNDLSKYKSTDALMMTITRNHCLDKIKTKKNKAFGLHEDYNMDQTTSLDEHTEYLDLVESVKKLIHQLPEQQRIIIHLRDVEGYDFEEIVKITGYDMNYIRVNISRGRKKIKESIIKMQSYDTSKTSRFN
jgi:RNA polymerase sigma-70 factor (ECF subfamily)